MTWDEHPPTHEAYLAQRQHEEELSGSPMRRLVIDDLRVLDLDGVVYARTPEYGLRLLLEEGPWDEVYLDHDMGVKDTKEIVATLEAMEAEGREPDLGLIWIVTSNPVAAEWMLRGLAAYGARRLTLPESTEHLTLEQSLDEAHQELAALQLLKQMKDEET